MNKYEDLMKLIDKQEEMLRFDKFTNEDGLELGNFLLKEAKASGQVVSVAVRKANGAILFHHLPEGTNCNNQNWMRRKFNTVCLWEHSSLRAFAHEHMSGETVQTHGFSEEEYIFFGGGFPIILKSGEFVGAVTVSNLPHFKDHQFVVDGIAKWLGVEGVPVAEEI